MNRTASLQITSNSSLYKKIIDICVKAAGKLTDPLYIEEISHKKENLFMNQKFSPWEPTTLGYGYPSLILLFSEMNMFSPNPKWENAYHTYIDLLSKELKLKGFIDPSLFAGLTGICFAIQFAAEQNSKYLKMHASLHSLLLNQLQKYYLTPIESAEKEGKLPLPIQYGIVSGLNGVLAYLLNYSTHQTSKIIINKILRHIVRLTGLIRIGSYEIPGWYANANYLVLKDGAQIYPKGVIEKHLDTYPEGCFDTGMVHGVSGCLAVLAKALLHGIKVPDHIKSMYNHQLVKEYKAGCGSNKASMA